MAKKNQQRTDWSLHPDAISYLLELRNSGVSFSDVAKMLTDRFGIACTKDQARGVFLRYSTDDELNKYVDGKQLVEKRRAQVNALVKSRETRQALDAVISQEDFLKELERVVKKIPREPIQVKLKKIGKTNQATVELLFSDWQIGKVSDNYNTDIAIRRLKEYTKAVIQKLTQTEGAGYEVEKVVLVLLGDIIESQEKATKKGSPRSVDSTTPEQLVNAIQGLFLHLVEPLAQLGIPVDVLGVAGNHDHIDNGMINFNPGKEHMTWVIYKSVELLSQQSGYKHVKFTIPQGYFVTYDYYGCKALYEHGYGLAANETQLNNRRNERMRQLEGYLHYFRMGDKHNIQRYNNDTLVVNGAFFETDKTGSEYASIAGYANQAAQLMFIHVPRKDSRLSIYDSFSIQLNHIK